MSPWLLAYVWEVLAFLGLLRESCLTFLLYLLSHHCDKIPNKSNVSKTQIVYISSKFGVYPYHVREERIAGHMVSTMGKQRDMNAGWYSTTVSFLFGLRP